MKLHKLISRTVVGTALLGATFGGVFAGINASADTSMNNPVSNGHHSTDSSKTYQQNSDGSGQSVSKDFKSSEDNTTVNITDGYLNLDSTPTFNFGDNSSAVNDSNAATNGNTLGLYNSTDSLTVTDYRASSQKSSNPTNWHLSAKVEPFKINGQNNNNTHSNDWKVHFNNFTFSSDKGSTTTQNNPTIQSNNSANPDVVDGGYGSTNINYSQNASQFASLNVPYNVQPGQYSTNMTWNLSTEVGSDLN